ncbi:MAG: FAD-dependent oxidoreductase, partial [Acidimicrobiales bacterium]
MTATDETVFYDIVVVGAGLVGLATASALLGRRPALRLAVVDKEPRVAAHQSSHNSGVLHAGVYYKAGSLKARLCVEGKRSVERFAEERGIPVERCGKLIVAVAPSELGRLADLRDRAMANGVEGVEELSGDQLREREPNVVGVRALHVPGTAIVDFERVACAYADEVTARGAILLLGRRVDDIVRRPGEQVLLTSKGDVRCRWLVSCAGLHADRVARRSSPQATDLQIVPFRGDYYRVVGPSRALVRGLVYP